MPDDTFAEALGLDEAQVGLSRKRLGIPAHAIDWDAQPLGQASDPALARLLGVPKPTVQRQRANRKIPRHGKGSHEALTVVFPPYVEVQDLQAWWKDCGGPEAAAQARAHDIDWDEQPLGEMTDAKLGLILDMPEEQVAEARRSRGIRSSVAHHDIDWDEQPLGKMTDAKLAEKLGISVSVVTRTRRQRDIPTFHKWVREQIRTHPQLGKVADEQLCEDIGCSRPLVSSVRQEQGIPAARKPRKPRRKKSTVSVTTKKTRPFSFTYDIDWTSQPLGKMTDRELAGKLDVPLSAVTSARKRLGIAAWRKKKAPKPPKPPKAPKPPKPPTTPKARGPKRGSKQQPWTDAEWAVINDALEHGNKATRAADLADSGLLPGRSRANIHNALNLARRRRDGLCLAGCGQPGPPKGSCDACKEKQKARRQARLKKGNCATCGDDLSQPGSSGTMCKRCRDRRSKYKPKANQRFNATRKKTDPRLTARRIIPWPACGHVKWAAQLAASTKRPVIDLCGGSGEPLRIVHEFDGVVHGYNDINPGLVALMRASRDPQRLQHVVRGVKTGTKPNLAARTVINARKPGAKYHPAFLTNMRRLGRALANAEITCLDAVERLRRPSPDDAVFIIDPPWPGTTFFDQMPDIPKLLEALLDLPYEQDYILMLGSERDALTIAAKHMRHAPLFWRMHGASYARSIVSLSPRLARDTPDPGNRISISDLGL